MLMHGLCERENFAGQMSFAAFPLLQDFLGGGQRQPFQVSYLLLQMKGGMGKVVPPCCLKAKGESTEMGAIENMFSICVLGPLNMCSL